VLPLTELLITGILEGALYSIMAMGLALILGVMRIVNIAHGDLMVFGSLISFWLFNIYGIDPMIGLLIVVPFVFAVGYLIQNFVIGPGIERTEAQTTASLIITYGLALIISQSEFIAWTGNFRAIVVPYTVTNIQIGSLSINMMRLLALGIIVLAAFFTAVLLAKTTFGKAIRACAQDRDAAQTLGIDFKKMANMTFGFSAALAALGGVLYITTHIVNPAQGISFTVKAFVALVVGGMGSVVGPFAAGLTIGVAETLGVYFLGGLWKETIAYLTLIIILLLRPRGILGVEEVQ